MGKSFWIVLTAAVVVLLGVFFLFGGDDSAPVERVDNPHEITADDHAKGAESPAVTLVEYGDFQCPACAAAYPMLKALADDYPEDLRIVYRHFLVTQPRNHTYDAARAAEAAARQDKFWEMHDLLFENQQEWSGDPGYRAMFESYAEEIGLDMERFDSDFADAGSRVDRDLAISQDLGVASTPTFYLDGEQIENPRTYEEFAQIIEEAIAEKQ